ncbi:toxin-antitoxin system YwqK family antitoxin [Lacinutrix sp. MEBiC02404]
MLFFNCQNKTVKKEQLTAVAMEVSLPEVSKSALMLKPNIGLVYYQDTPFTGISVLSYPNGNMAESIPYKNGKKDGTLKKWFENETLSFEAFYKNGKLEETATSWWLNGNIRSESHYKNGIANGIQKQWYKTGELFKQMTIVNGKEEGMQKAWRRNGKIYNNYEAKNGRIFGLKRANLCFQLEEEIVQDEKL